MECKTKIGVTGGSGFIGSKLVMKLSEKGHEVTSIDKVAPVESISGYAFAKCDLLDYSKARSILCGFDVVYHLAGWVLEPVRKDPFMGSGNMNITRNVIDACHINNIGKVFFASSCYMYDGINEEMLVNEETPLNIGNMEVFTIVKAFGECFLKEYRKKYGLHYVILRYGSAYGYNNCSNIVQTFLKACWDKQPMEVWGQGKRRNQYTYVNDIVDGSMLAIDKVDEIINLISPEATTIRELAEILRSRLGGEIIFNAQKNEGASFPYMSSRKAIEELGWKPIALKQGIEQIIREHEEGHS